MATDPSLNNLQRKVNRYQEVLENTNQYRKAWKAYLQDFIRGQLETTVAAVGLQATVELRDGIDNLEAVALSLGNVKSGMATEVAENIHRDLIKHNGTLVYQQLFNGKIIVMIQYPFIENYGEPRPPKTIAIYRPEELKEPFFVRHLEQFIDEITAWEDYDDDNNGEPNQRIGFKLNFDTPEGGK